MSTTTANLGLTKPELSDVISPAVFANNFDLIDEAYAELEEIISSADSAHIEVVTYVGTGTVGINNPNSVTFSNAPTVIALFDGYDGSAEVESRVAIAWTFPISTTDYAGSFGYNRIAKSVDGKTIRWYASGTDPERQRNISGRTYAMIGFY